MNKETILFKGAKYRALNGKSGVRWAYDRMANDYDHSNYLLWTRRMEKGEERIIKNWIGYFSIPTLDIGCGTGRYSIKIAEKGFEVVALDVSLGMLKKTRKKTRKKMLFGRVHPILADGENLPFKSESFSSLICTLTFDHFQNDELAAQEFSRVLKKGGFLVISTVNSYTLSDFKRRYNLPPDKVPFRTESLSPVLIYEVGHSIDEIKELFKREFEIIDVKGCCYWHLLPLPLIIYYKTKFDFLFNIFKFLLKYAEIHVILMKKR